MQPSFNEIEMEAKKAARGAGHPWGIAEEIGHAMDWLARRGINALPALLDILSRQDGAGTIDRQAKRAIDGGKLDAVPLCPLALGMAIADRASLMASGQIVACGPVLHPILLFPFLAVAARVTNQQAIANIDPGTWRIGTDRCGGQDLAMAVDMETAPEIRCHLEAATPVLNDQRAGAARLVVQPEIWRQLQAFARRTYVPATEQSRALGAGAGAIDND